MYHSHLSLFRHALWAMSLVAVVLAGCGADIDDGDPPGNIEPPLACRLSAPPADWAHPAGPYGDQVGETFADITLDDCDGEPVSLGDVLGQSELLLFNVGAGWCQPCVEESMTLDSEIFRPFCGRGLRVVQVLFQDDQSRPATKLFCSQWRERFGLSFPVLVDALFETGTYFDSVSAQTPLNFLIAPNGEIVYKEVGTPAADLPERIDALLPPSAP